MSHISRRTFLTSVGSALAATSCSLNVEPTTPLPESAALTARPGTPTSTATAGTIQLWNGSPSAYLVVPEGIPPSTSLPLVVSLHGAGGNADGPLGFLGPFARSEKFFLLVPDSRDRTWDAIIGMYGPDIATIDRALRIAFGVCRVDPTRITLEGFSDGASYALGVGLTNAELFTRVVAFSPGLITSSRIGPTKPKVFVSHGRQDSVLPFQNTNLNIVPLLRTAGCDVDFRPFDGGHTIPADIAQAAVQFMISG